MKSNILVIARCISDQFGLRISKAALRRALEVHPSYPNINALTETLPTWNVFSMWVQLDKTQSPQLPSPCIVHTNNGWTVVSSVSGNGVAYLSPEEETITCSHEQFSEIWTGITIIPSLLKKSIPSLKTRIDVLKNRILWIALAVLLSWMVYQALPLSLPLIACLAICTGGAFAARRLIVQETDDRRVDKYCHAGKYFNCTRVTSGDVLKKLHLTSLATVGFSYFIAVIIFIFITGYGLHLPASTILPAILAPSAAGAGISLIAVWYQFRKKAWCIYCLAISFLNLLLFITCVAAAGFPGADTGISLVNLLIMFALIHFLGVLITDYFRQQASRILRLSYDSGRLLFLKQQVPVFDALLKEQPAMQTPFHEIPDHISLGVENAPVQLLLLLDARCPGCRSSALELFDIYRMFNRHIHLKIVFVEEDRPACNTAFLPLKDHPADEAATLKLLQEVFSTREYIRPGHPAFGQLKSFLQRPASFILREGIVASPEVYVNGHKYSAAFAYDDLKYFIGAKIYG